MLLFFVHLRSQQNITEKVISTYFDIVILRVAVINNVQNVRLQRWHRPTDDASACRWRGSHIGGFNQRQGEALSPQIFLTLSRFVFTVQTRKLGSVYYQNNYRNCCHPMSDFKAKKAPNSMSAGAPPHADPPPQILLGELTALSQTPSWPHPRSRPSGPWNNLPPQIRISKSAYVFARDWSSKLWYDCVPKKWRQNSNHYNYGTPYQN